MRMWTLATIVTAGMLVAGCGGEEDYSAPEGTPALKMFEQACSHCHGEKGTGKFGFLLGLKGSQIPAENVVPMIANGGGIMPAFPELSESQRQRLAEYAAGLSQGGD